MTRRVLLALAVAVWATAAAGVGAARAGGSGAFISPAGQGFVIGVTNRISYISPEFNPADGESASWTFNTGTVTGHRTGVICDGAHVSDGVAAPTDGNTSYPGRVPSSGSSHGPVSLPDGATACRIYMFHASGYGSNTHNGGLYSYAAPATPTPTPGAPAPTGVQDVNLVGWSEDVHELLDMQFMVAAAFGVSTVALLTVTALTVATRRGR